MQFVFENNRSSLEQNIYDLRLSKTWRVSDVFQHGRTCDDQAESTRLKYAPVLVSLAFGEATAFHGFGARISSVEDIGAKNWLVAHLLDESRHTEGFSELLNYLYPSFVGKHDVLMRNKHPHVFYGRTHRVAGILEWLLCTQFAETFGRLCYKELYKAFAHEAVVSKFLKYIIEDEQLHISYIGSLISTRRRAIGETEWNKTIAPFVKIMVPLCRNMFEGRKKGATYNAFASLGIDVVSFCDHAELELNEKFLTSSSMEYN